MAAIIRVEAMCMTCPNRLHASNVDSTIAADEVDRTAHAAGWRDDFPNGNWICNACVAIAASPSRASDPVVCPGCHAVGTACAPGCIDDEIRRKSEEPDLSDDDDDTENDL